MEIQRLELMKDFSAFAFEGNGIVVGPPGVGKTYVLKSFISQLIEKNIPCLYLPIDKLGVDTETALKKELDVKDDFIAYLENQSMINETKIGVIVIDSFDAARSEKAQKFFLGLIRRIQKNLSNRWNIVVSVRTYDAKKSEELYDLFPTIYGKKIKDDFQIKDIRCRHFAIPLLTHGEVIETVKTIPNLYDIYTHGSSEFRELLRIPFNLWLLEKLLAIEPNLPQLSSIISEIQLLGLFWKQRVTDGPLGDARRVLLTRIIREMVQQRSLSVRKEEVYSFGIDTVWNSSLSSELLVDDKTTSFQRVAFSHNILFDYAVSVLLIEDEPDKLVEFIVEDPSRPLFLRPSLNYYYTRLWHTRPQLFWKSFWYIQPSSDVHLHLFARLLPSTVIANEARNIEQLKPLLKSLEEESLTVNKAVLYLLQAVRALKIIRDDLWIKFLLKASETPHRIFVWELAVITSSILERAEVKNIIDICGKISRNLLCWVWEERKGKKDDWINSFGARNVIPLVADTFNTDKKTSRSLLEKVLNLTEEKGFPIQFLYWMTEKLDKIWPYDPELVSKTYFVVFGYCETSEDITSFGTPVLPMTSTRRQDFEMCQYQVIRHFPHFLRANPKAATKTAIMCLNHYVIQEHVIKYLKEDVRFEDLEEKFPFLGKKAVFIPDGCYIWDKGTFSDQPMKIADELFKFINELVASKGKSQIIKSLFIIFRDNAKVAFFWKRLLKIGSEKPEVFSSLLFDLCIARPIQTGAETIYELGVFLEKAFIKFNKTQRDQIEKNILVLPSSEKDTKKRKFLERYRDRLLSRIPKDLLVKDETKKLRIEIEKADKVPPHEPLVTFESWSKPFTEEDWLKEKGVDVNRIENKKLIALYSPLEKFITEWHNKIPTSDAIKSILPYAENLFTSICSLKNADKAVQDAAWTKLASCFETVSRALANIGNDEYEFCRKILLLSARHELPKPDPEYDSEFNTPHWSPSPRNEAAQGLPRLVDRKKDEEVLKEIERLVRDRVPSVRFLSTMELWRISSKEEKIFWKLAKYIAENEENLVVLNAFCYSLAPLISKKEKEATELLDKLLKKKQLLEEDSNLLVSFISIVVDLAIRNKNDWAVKTIKTFLEDPISYSKPLKGAALYLLNYIKPQNLATSKSSQLTDQAIMWLLESIKSANKGIEEIRSIPDSKWNEHRKSKFGDLYDVIDRSITLLHFASGTRTTPSDNKEMHVSNKLRKDFYFKIKPVFEQILLFASDKEDGILLARTAHYFMEFLNNVIKYDPKGALHMATQVASSSKSAGYAFDSLAIREVVIFVETILANFRSEVRDGKSLLDLLNLLDIFVEAGWPEALNLVWRLDEVFR